LFFHSTHFAPSVCLPESFAPSARLNLFPECYAFLSVLLPESFRGGCSFGANISSLSRYNIRLLVNIIKSNIKYLKLFIAFIVN
jgi:hypothetical protein